MGGKKKQKRFNENAIFSNVLQPTREQLLEDTFPLKAKWAEYFGNDHPIILELGCGKGEYTIELAKKDSSRNYIGIDIKGARLWRGAKTALEEELSHVTFIRTQIELVHFIFAENEVSEIWITFPDPQIKFKRTKHRLTNQNFLEKYRFILNEQGTVNLKTDSEFLHGYTLGLLHGSGQEIIYANHDVYKNEGSPKDVLEIQTFYENQYLEEGKPITFIKFRLK